MVNTKKIKVIVFALAIAISFFFLTFNVMIIYSTAWKGPSNITISSNVHGVERIIQNNTDQYYGLFSRSDLSDYHFFVGKTNSLTEWSEGLNEVFRVFDDNLEEGISGPSDTAHLDLLEKFNIKNRNFSF